MKIKKYDTYLVEIIHLNGNKQIKKSNNPRCYKSTLSLYKEIKENYVGHNITINFIGLSDYERGIIFTKKNSSAENNKRDIKVLIDVLVETSQELRDKLNGISGAMDLINKKKSNIEHLFVEAVNVETLDDDKKIEVFNQLREITLERRDYKILNQVRESIFSGVDLMARQSKFIMEEYEKIIKTNLDISQEIITNENSKLREIHLIKEYPYKNFKERMNLMKQLQGKYDKIVNIEDKGVLACYNKCKSA